MKKALFIFRRDLRIIDNTALLKASREADHIIPLFIFDPVQVEPHPYRSTPGFQFMLESLNELQAHIVKAGGKLNLCFGPPSEVVADFIKKGDIKGVFFNKDYTPFSRQRDEELEQVCRTVGVEFCSCDDALLNSPGSVLKGDGNPYQIYTPFLKASKKLPVVAPNNQIIDKFFADKIDSKFKTNLDNYGSTEILVGGGRSRALTILKSVTDFKKYDQERDFPALDKTSRLSAHNKFGTVSVREVYKAVSDNLGSEHTLIRELYWRDFFNHIGYFFPHVYESAFSPRYDRIKWRNDLSEFEAWQNGRTGFPIVDAGMRELNKSGFMHNRVRMIVASFLTKDLQIDWRWGEKYFAQKLVDYDPAVNNGNWQWASSSGCDAQPYFRIFNPWLQQKKFDPDCVYIKRWIPELESLSAAHIHQLINGEGVPLTGYPAPMVDHFEAKEITADLYEEALKN